jgi:hypothetical protein
MAFWMRRRRGMAKALAPAILSACALGAFAASAAAAPPPLFNQFGERGTGAGQFEETRSIVASPLTGHVFSVDGHPGQPRTNRIDEFTAWGEFVEAWGWGVRDGAAELQTCGPGATPPSASCLPGLEGGGGGQLDQPSGIAIDSGGDLYVFERGNERVQKFSPSGEFILAFGGKVDQATEANICTAASGDVCQAGAIGAANGEFSLENFFTAIGNYIGVSPADVVYVGDTNRIQEFDADGSFIRAIPLPQPGSPGYLAVDPVSGDLYFSFSRVLVNQRAIQPNVYRLDPETGAVIDELAVPIPSALATDAAGNVYVVTDYFQPQRNREVLEFDASGAPVIPIGSHFAPSSGEILINALATNTVTAAGGVDLLVGFETAVGEVPAISVFGPAPDKWPPPVKPPVISGQFASAVGTDSSTLKAQINPRFWDDTRYFLEYGKAPCSGGGCTQVPGPPGVLLGAGVVNRPVTTDGIELAQLDPGTTYHYRFVAQSSGGGPVLGQGEAHLEGEFTTRVAVPPKTDCPNQQFRTGASALLPDCRAYEMVSPVDKNNGDILVQCDAGCFPARLDQAAENGGRVAYSSYRAFAEAQSSPYSSQYLATRGPDGWTSRSLNTPQEGVPSRSPGILDTLFQRFSPELDQAWFTRSNEPVLDPLAISGYSNLYRLDLGSGAYRAFVTTKPVDTAAASFEAELQGVSADGTRAVFRANGKLTGNAPSKGKEFGQLYEWEDGSLHLVSVRPNGTPSAESAQVGTAVQKQPVNRLSSLHNAVSADGSRIFWTEKSIGPGKLYVRVDGSKTELISAEPTEFITADPSGATAIFRVAEGPGEGKLSEFDVDTEQVTTIAPSVLATAGSSEDAGTVYFVSTAALAGAGIAGKPNLYVHVRGGGTSFIATLESADLKSDFAVAPIGSGVSAPNRRGTRVTPDGGAIVFMSQARLTAYDNLDANSGLPDAEVYRYDAATQALSCISCNPTGSRPQGAPLEQARSIPSEFWGAAQIPTWSTSLYASRAVSNDGRRIFFQTRDPLALHDTNGKVDVYEWEAPETGDCTSASLEFVQKAGGCIGLISSGEGASDSEFVDATADGSEVFFTTGDKLVAQDPGLRDLYVARVGGGFPAPPPPPPTCAGEECQPQVLPPNPAPAGSGSFFGPGNPKPAPSRRCGKGAHRVKKHGKVRCVRDKRPNNGKRGGAGR